jgi:hypothetical protein
MLKQTLSAAAMFFQRLVGPDRYEKVRHLTVIPQGILKLYLAQVTRAGLTSLSI